MEINPATPALLYPTVSLLMLAYTQRFLALAALIRSLHVGYREQPDPLVLQEIASLRFRIGLIRNMQWMGVLSLLFCTLCLFLLYSGEEKPAEWAFGVALLLMIGSLILSAVEIQHSVHALNLHLTDLKNAEERKG